MSQLKIGDRVLECTRWKPGTKQQGKKLGEGVVTLIVDNVETEEDRKLRIIWKSGALTWHTEAELVNIERIVGYNK